MISGTQQAKTPPGEIREVGFAVFGLCVTLCALAGATLSAHGRLGGGHPERGGRAESTSRRGYSPAFAVSLAKVMVAVGAVPRMPMATKASAITGRPS
mgnify:CR=1 FL=1